MAKKPQTVRFPRFHEIRAAQLHEEFLQGNRIALFQCMHLWREESHAFDSLPGWVMEAWGKVGADFYQSCIDNAMQSKRPPSLDIVAGLRTGKQKATHAWKQANRVSKSKTVRAYVDNIVAKAKNQSTPHQYVHKDAHGAVHVLNARGQLSEHFLHHVAERFNVGTGSGKRLASRAPSMKKLLGLAEK